MNLQFLVQYSHEVWLQKRRIFNTTRYIQNYLVQDRMYSHVWPIIFADCEICQICPKNNSSILSYRHTNSQSFKNQCHHHDNNNNRNNKKATSEDRKMGFQCNKYVFKLRNSSLMSVNASFLSC